MSDSLQRRIALGMTLGMDSTGGTNYTVLGAVVDGFDFDGGSKQVADMSILSDTYIPKAGGQIDAGKCSFMIAWDPLATTTTSARLAAARALTGVTPPAFQLTFPAAGTENTAQTSNFAGWVTKIGKTFKKDKLLVATVEIDISGNPNDAGN